MVPALGHSPRLPGNSRRSLEFQITSGFSTGSLLRMSWIGLAVGNLRDTKMLAAIRIVLLRPSSTPGA